MSKNKAMLLPLFAYAIFQLPLIGNVKFAEYDESIYLNVARNISRTGIANRFLDGGVLYAEHTSLYQHFIGLLHLVVGDQILLFRLITTLFGALIIWSVWSIVEENAGWEAALVSSVIVSVNPFFHHYAFFIREEIWMCLFIILAIWSLSRSKDRPTQKRPIFSIALFVSLAFLTKELSLIFSFFAILFLFITGKGMVDRLYRVFVPTVAIATSFGLWCLWIFIVDANRFAAVFSRWLSSIFGSSGGTQFDFWASIKWLELITTSILTPSMVALFLVGLFVYGYKSVQTKSTDNFVWFVAFYPLFAVIVSLLIDLKRDRHIMPIIFSVAIAIGLLIDWDPIFVWVKKSILNRSLSFIVLIIVLFEMSPMQLPEDWRRFDSFWENNYFQRLIVNDRNYGVLQQAGSYLNQKTTEDEIIYVNNAGPVIGFYADRHYLFLYNYPYEQILDFLTDSTWLVEDAETYLKLTPEEKDSVLRIIGCGFTVDQVIQDSFRRIEILHKRNDVSFELCISNETS